MKPTQLGAPEDAPTESTQLQRLYYKIEDAARRIDSLNDWLTLFHRRLGGSGELVAKNPEGKGGGASLACPSLPDCMDQATQIHSTLDQIDGIRSKLIELA